VLLTLATGTGETFVAMQIVWVLWDSGWRPGRRARILYLADRNILIDQRRRDYFALYQAIADSGEDEDGIFREFAPDFFDLVIVDECHCGPLSSIHSPRASTTASLRPTAGVAC
jgi:type I restriction enzyme R subunit